jgi:hypothetical protein
MLGAIKSLLRKSFSMKDLGEAAYILGIKIYRERENDSDSLYFGYWIHHLYHVMHAPRCFLCSKCYEEVSIKLW